MPEDDHLPFTTFAPEAALAKPATETLVSGSSCSLSSAQEACGEPTPPPVWKCSHRLAAERTLPSTFQGYETSTNKPCRHRGPGNKGRWGENAGFRSRTACALVAVTRSFPSVLPAQLSAWAPQRQHAEGAASCHSQCSSEHGSSGPR